MAPRLNTWIINSQHVTVFLRRFDGLAQYSARLRPSGPKPRLAINNALRILLAPVPTAEQADIVKFLTMVMVSVLELFACPRTATPRKSMVALAIALTVIPF